MGMHGSGHWLLGRHSTSAIYWGTHMLPFHVAFDLDMSEPSKREKAEATRFPITSAMTTCEVSTRQNHCGLIRKQGITEGSWTLHSCRRSWRNTSSKGKFMMQRQVSNLC
jgi:hypothetical protein